MVVGRGMSRTGIVGRSYRSVDLGDEDFSDQAHLPNPARCKSCKYSNPQDYEEHCSQGYCVREELEAVAWSESGRTGD